MKSTELTGDPTLHWHCGDTVWACAFAYDKTPYRMLAHQKPIQGKLFYSRYGDGDQPSQNLRPRYFVPMTKDKKNFQFSRAVSIRAREYADTEQEAIQIYNSLIQQKIDQANYAIAYLQQQFLPGQLYTIDELRHRIDYEQPMIDSSHRSAIWYGGDVASLTTGGYTLTLSANGDVITDYTAANGVVTSVRDKSNHGVFHEKMRNIIPDDDAIIGLLSEPDDIKPNLNGIDTNWWEVFITRDGEQIDSTVMDTDYYDEAVTEMLELTVQLLNGEN